MLSLRIKKNMIFFRFLSSFFFEVHSCLFSRLFSVALMIAHIRSFSSLRDYYQNRLGRPLDLEKVLSLGDIYIAVSRTMKINFVKD